MSRRQHTAFDLLLIVITACALYLPFLGGTALFDWDEINFAECAREMLITGNYKEIQLNFQPFWEKPPLFIWLQVASMKLFGINEFAARFPNVVCGILTLCTLYLIGSKHFDRRMGSYWVLFYAGSLLPHFYFRSGIMDPWFNYFIFLSLYFFYRSRIQKKNLTDALIAALFGGLAVLTKGPAALLIIAGTVLSYLIWTRQLKQTFLSKQFLIFTLFTLIASGSWFLITWLRGESDVIRAFITYQIRLAQTKDAGHGGPFFYHALVLLLGCFPASLFFIAAYQKKEALTEDQAGLRYLLLSLFWTVLLIFSFVETKIVHYSSLCYFPITFIAAIGLHRLNTLNYSRSQRKLFRTVATILLLAISLFGFSAYLLPMLTASGFIHDISTLAVMNATIPQTGLEPLLPLLFLLAALSMDRALIKQNTKRITQSLIIHLLFICAGIYLIVPLVERYTQGAAIAFYKATAGRECYLETYKFKSYAYLFYGQVQAPKDERSEQKRAINQQLDVMEKEGHSRLESYATANAIWMTYGAIDKPAYLIAKTGNDQELSNLNEVHKLYEQNGYSFYVHLPKK